MNLDSVTVALQRSRAYNRSVLKGHIDSICKALGFSVSPGSKVLLKPNLISARGHDGLACTNPQFVAAAAEWFLDHGAKVRVGDSPAFGTGRKVMESIGLTEALSGMDLKAVDFDRPLKIELSGGRAAGVAAEALDCDILVNLPKVKAHSQLFMTMAVKNYFGTVVGIQKPVIHARYGDKGRAFEELLVDLLAVLPDGISLVDGVVAMQGEGPIRGYPCQLGVLAGALNPVAVDTALMQVLGAELNNLPLWRECRRRNLPGVLPEDLLYPLLFPHDLPTAAFTTPQKLKPISFHPWHLLRGSVKRIISSVT